MNFIEAKPAERYFPGCVWNGKVKRHTRLKRTLEVRLTELDGECVKSHIFGAHRTDREPPIGTMSAS